jgi:flagellar hook assembly protein FlgD
VLGEEVAVLQDGIMSAGVHRLTWNGRNQAGREMSTGLYLYRLESPAAILLGKMLLLR